MPFASVNSLAGKLLITGDLNVHFYRPPAPDYVTGRLLDLELFDLSWFHWPIRSHVGPGIPQRAIPLWCINYLHVAKPPHRPVFQTTRDQRNIDRTHLCADVATCIVSRSPATRHPLRLTSWTSSYGPRLMPTTQWLANRWPLSWPPPTLLCGSVAPDWRSASWLSIPFSAKSPSLCRRRNLLLQSESGGIHKLLGTIQLDRQSQACI